MPQTDDGRTFYNISAAGKRRVSEGEDDTRAGEWVAWAYVRLATDAEAAPVMARIMAEREREQLRRDLGTQHGERYHGAMPADATVLVPEERGRYIPTGERIAVVDGAVLHERVGDPDMLDSAYRYVVRITDAALVERAAQFIAAKRA